MTEEANLFYIFKSFIILLVSQVLIYLFLITQLGVEKVSIDNVGPDGVEVGVHDRVRDALVLFFIFHGPFHQASLTHWRDVKDGLQLL